MELDKLFFNTIKLNNSIKTEKCKTTRWMLTHKLIHKHNSGIYTYLPLGWLYINHIQKYIKKYMEDLGYFECKLPIITFKDKWPFRNLNNFSLNDKLFVSPTSEETFIDLNTEIKLFQFSNNIRREIRTKNGLCRTNEFIMKDAYAMFRNHEDSTNEYERILIIYNNLFNDLELNTVKNNVYQYGDTTEFLVEGITTQTTIFDNKNMVEIGHVFNFAFDIFKKHLVSFGIGISRLLHMLIELKLMNNQSLVDNINPIDKWIVPTNDNLLQEGINLYKQLKKQNPNLNIVLDNRKTGFGEKIKDAEELFPKTIIILGKNYEQRKFNKTNQKWEKTY